MDASSELVHSLLPVFLTGVLGASMVAVGLIEGLAEATASVVKVITGALSDRLGRRKPLVVLGYGLAALSKPLFPLAGSVALVLGARFADRLGKGIRGAPRDALIADVQCRCINEWRHGHLLRRIAAGQRLNRELSAAQEDRLYVEAVFFEQTGVLRHPDMPLAKT